jgi:hypothetical protein
MISGIRGGQNADLSVLWQEQLNKADKDGDGKVSKAEFKTALPQAGDDLFDKLDANGDGFIDKTESAAAAKSRHGRKHHAGADPLKLFTDADKDSDGKISKADFKSALPEGTDSATANQVFDSMDTNQDGVVDASEYMAAMKKTSLFTQLFPQEGLSTLA